MKFTVKPLLAATLIAVGGAQAAQVGEQIGPGPFTFVGGAGTLKFSFGSHFNGTDPNTIGGLIGALNVGRVEIRAIAPAEPPYEAYLVDETGEEVRVDAQVTAPVTGIDVNASTGQVLSVTSAGGARQVGTRVTGTLTGGTADVTNLRFDLVNRVVYADLAGRKNAIGTRPAVDFVLNNTALWTFDHISGPTSIPTFSNGVINLATLVADMQAAGFSSAVVGGQLQFTAENTISGLKVTQEGFNFFVNSLGLLSTGVGALNAVNEDPMGWGTVNARITVAVVPEPSTYGLAFAGLLVAGVCVRRRRG